MNVANDFSCLPVYARVTERVYVAQFFSDHAEFVSSHLKIEFRLS